MSAYVVSKETIDVLVAALAQFEIKHELGVDAETIGRALWRENVLSVAERYDLAREDPAELAGYWDDVNAYAPRALGALSAVGALKVVHCYDYQSCEHDGWEASAARAAMNALDAKIEQTVGENVTRSRAYDAAPWGIKDEAELASVQRGRA